ncbi:phosphotransferase [Mycobacterium attenuatum]|uniref:phosphotransferase n=1 Tax=Mycobacterium attenuatum TaxID=2341086 RepID=UPI000F0214F9|nr:phosphotransferase [Mycobacterium attenuatum]
MTNQFDRLIERTNDLTAAWLSGAIQSGTIVDFDVEPIGAGLMSECYRIRLRYAANSFVLSKPQSVVLKLVANDEVSMRTGWTLGFYEREVRFYRDLARRVNGPIATCYHAAFDASTGIFNLLLGDVNPAVAGDEIRGATVEQARLAVVALGRIHGSLIGDATLAETPWLNQKMPITQTLITELYPDFLKRYGNQISPPHRALCDRVVASFGDYRDMINEADGPRMFGLIHGDYRLDNLLFGTAADQSVTVIDWQAVCWGPLMADLAYFLGCAIATSDRRRHYDALLQAYHEALGAQSQISLADVHESVRRRSPLCVARIIASAMLVGRTDRGDAMIRTVLQRNCEHVLDIGWRSS